MNVSAAPVLVSFGWIICNHSVLFEKNYWQGLARTLLHTSVWKSNTACSLPMKREQTPGDIGWAAVFLASDQARNITDQALHVEGGVVM